MKKIILVVDDSASVRKFISFALSAKGFDVLQASDGMQALEMIATQRVELIITDLNMPNIDGYEFIKSFRKNDSYKNVPVIILSSLGNNEDIQTAMMCGADSYLRKPLDPQKILYEVSKYIS